MNKHNRSNSAPSNTHRSNPEHAPHAKLPIRRETVRLLTERQLQGVVGGIIIDTGSSSDPTKSHCK